MKIPLKSKTENPGTTKSVMAQHDMMAIIPDSSAQKPTFPMQLDELKFKPNE